MNDWIRVTVNDQIIGWWRSKEDHVEACSHSSYLSAAQLKNWQSAIIYLKRKANING